MIELTVKEIGKIIGSEALSGDPDCIVNRVAIDSRAVQKNDCFFAIVGPRDDGHRYLADVAEAGASVVVIDGSRSSTLATAASSTSVIAVDETTAALQTLAAHVRERVKPKLVAITGSLGKTTTKSLAYDLVKHRWPTLVSPGNFNNQWGLPLSLLRLEPRHEVMITELGMSAAGEIRTLAAIAQPEIGLITNIAPVHMAFFDDLPAVAAAKQELAEAVPADGVLIVNADDPRTVRIAAAFSDRVGRVLTFGLAESAEIAARDPIPTGNGWCLRLQLPSSEPVETELTMPGRHSLSNFLAATAIAHTLGLSAQEVADRARGLSLPSMRGQLLKTPSGVLVFDDSYNASPTAMMGALDTLASLPTTGRRVLAAGDMLELGTWAEDAHREVGLHAAQLELDRVVTVGELARDIGYGARAGGLAATAIRSFATPEEAAAELEQWLQPGDLVLVKGSRAVQMERVTTTLLRESPGPREGIGQEG